LWEKLRFNPAPFAMPECAMPTSFRKIIDKAVKEKAVPGCPRRA